MVARFEYHRRMEEMSENLGAGHPRCVIIRSPICAGDAEGAHQRTILPVFPRVVGH